MTTIDVGAYWNGDDSPVSIGQRITAAVIRELDASGGAVVESRA